MMQEQQQADIGTAGVCFAACPLRQQCVCVCAAGMLLAPVSNSTFMLVEQSAMSQVYMNTCCEQGCRPRCSSCRGCSAWL